MREGLLHDLVANEGKSENNEWASLRPPPPKNLVWKDHSPRIGRFPTTNPFPHYKTRFSRHPQIPGRQRNNLSSVPPTHADPMHLKTYVWAPIVSQPPVAKAFYMEFLLYIRLIIILPFSRRYYMVRV
jgi:hypothetical protein